MTPPSTPGQDGGDRELLSERALDRATARYVTSSGDPLDRMRAALALVAPDLVRAERDRVRGECAEELRAKLTSGPIGRSSGERYVFAPHLHDLAASWSTPDPASPS